MKSENEIEVNDELIVRYLTGEAKPEEAIALNDWLEEAENRFYFEKLAETWRAMHPMKMEMFARKEDAWEKISKETTSAVEQKQKRQFPLRGLGFRVAAVFIFVIISGWVIYGIFGKKNNESILTLDNQEQVIFSDSSKVNLYHNTLIFYPQEFKEHSREVELVKGEAFFSVTPDKQKPFIIHTSLADIEVVGTQFNVIAKEDHIEVEVKEGSVFLSTLRGSAYLNEGSTATIKSGDRSIMINEGVNINSWAYATRKFEFKDTPIRDVIRDVEKVFACSISVSAENINKCKLTATFDNDSAEKIVSLIAETLNLSLKKNGRIFTLEGEGCP